MLGLFLISSLFVLAQVATTAAAADDASSCVPGIDVDTDAMGNGTDWPALFRLDTPDPLDPTQPNEDMGAETVLPEVLLEAGVQYMYLDPAGYTYPNATKEIPWSPPANGTNDMQLQQIRDEYDFQYADIVVVNGFSEKFYEEHIHPSGDEVRYIIDGSGYFDIRDVNDEWVRVHAGPGDLIVFPTGIDHRFTVDDSLYIQAMRLYPGSGAPDWSSVSRSNQTNNSARQDYVNTYLCGIDPTGDDDHDHDHDASHDEGHDMDTTTNSTTSSGGGAGQDHSDASHVHDEDDAETTQESTEMTEIEEDQQQEDDSSSPMFGGSISMISIFLIAAINAVVTIAA